eukprot:5024291-Pyramimonas_sp.AAC.1
MNGKIGFSAKRYVRGLCRLGVMWYQAQLQEGPSDQVPDREHGYLPGRNREGAMICQEALHWRLRRL